jgi:hypothetical protein
MKVDGINAGLSASAIMAECGDLLQPHTATTLAYVAAADWEVECPGPSSVQVVYNGGSGNGDVDYTAAMATGTQQGSSVQLPLLMRGDHAPIGLHFCAPPGQFVYLSLQGTQSISAVRCVIDVDGIRISSNESHGAYTIASCDGQA